ncbi:MAG: DUF1049 domain-containing protein [Mycobacteriaceae bacterium]
MSTDPTHSTRAKDATEGRDGKNTSTTTGDGSVLRVAARTRSGTTYAFLLIGTLVAVALVVFIVQNLDRHPVKFFWLSWNLPLGINMLITALAAALITGLVGAVRIAQLKRAHRKG